MPESPTQTSGPSLEQILWRAVDRFREDPAVVDAEEFADHIAHAFDAFVPEEAFAQRFLEGDERMHSRSATLADAVVQRANRRLHVYEFDLDRLEYVVVEEKDKLVVVSEFGQFAVESDDAARRALEAAVVKAQDRAGREPRAYFVRRSGEVAGVDVKQVARTLDRLMVRQVSDPAVQAPAKRLAVFNPVRGAMTPAREERALRQDPRLLRPLSPLPEPPRGGGPGQDLRAPLAAGQDRSDAGSVAQAALVAPQPPPARPRQAGAPPATLFFVMPDGSMAHARIGAANRWERMLAFQARTAAQSLAIESENVLAIVSGVTRSSTGETALTQADAVAEVRSARIPVRALSGDETARALVAGARVAPAVDGPDRFWIHPEQAFRPGRAEPPRAVVAAAPVELGEITGDPWADWALAVTGTVSGARAMPAAGAKNALRAAADRGGIEPPPVAWRASGVRGQALRLAGMPVVAFRAPDGTILAAGSSEPYRLASPDRPDGPGPEAPVVWAAGPQPAALSGGVPSTALQTLRFALERTAAAGAYRLPLARLESAPDAIEAGAALPLAARQERAASVRLAGPVVPAGAAARLVLSMPFPNRGELHVGPDLAEALDTWLAAPVTAARPEPDAAAAVASPRFAGKSRAAQAIVSAPGPAAGVSSPASGSPAGMSFELRREQTGRLVASGETEARHGAAIGSARRAILTLDLPAVRPLLGRDPSLSGIPDLLNRAVAGSGDWSIGSSLPAPVRELAARAPFSGSVELVADEPERIAAPGEEEIVIPLPLWAQMGRGALSETDRILAAPRASAPPLGTYRLVAPEGGPVDLGWRAPADAKIVDLSGPTSLRLAARPSGNVTATTLGGSHLVAKVPLNVEGPSRPRGRIRVGGPLQGPGAASLVSAAREATRPAASPSGGTPVGPTAPLRERSLVTGLPAGMWSGHRPSSTADYQSWAYGARRSDQPQVVGGIQLSGVARPSHPQVPVALRFRYAAAPLWWSAAARTSAVDGGGDASPASGALKTGLRAANSAAALWRSILVAGTPEEDFSGGMDTGRDVSAEAMNPLAGKLDAFAAPLVAHAAPAAAASAPTPAAAAYIAMTSSGSAGAVPASAAVRARAEAVEMSIVAAIPPAPPRLESTSAALTSSSQAAPHARAKTPGEPPAHGQAKEADDAVSHSKIEGSVDAIAQRIFHRIRSRMLAEYERSGGSA